MDRFVDKYAGSGEIFELPPFGKTVSDAYVTRNPYPSLGFGVRSVKFPYELTGLHPELHVQFGSVLPPHFHLDYPIAVMYGGIGTVVAQAIIDIIDEHIPSQRRNDSLQCLQGQKEPNPEAVQLTMSALNAAYITFQFLEQVIGEGPPIPKMHNHTGEELLFMAYARLWCDKDSVGQDHKTAVENFDKAIIQERLFAHAFRCTGTKYTPDKVCNFMDPVFGIPKDPAATTVVSFI